MRRISVRFFPFAHETSTVVLQFRAVNGASGRKTNRPGVGPAFWVRGRPF